MNEQQRLEAAMDPNERIVVDKTFTDKELAILQSKLNELWAGLNGVKPIKVMRIQEGDVLLLKVQGKLSDVVYKRICTMWEQLLIALFPGKGVKAAVLEQGMDVEAIRADRKET